MSIEVKICGLTNVDDALAALEYGADYLGFVFYSQSPRFVTPAAVVKILDAIKSPVKAVGVFVNMDRIDVEVIAGDCGLCAVQLNGSEKAEDYADMPFPVWRALRVGQNSVEPPPETWSPARFLLDAAAPGLHGGTGIPADWKRAAEIARKSHAMLAGGLTPENVADAIRAVNPRGVDVSSGVESSPGKKDLKKLQQFIRAAKNCLER
jgi:phosphoribosylanthranilate isomerase